MNDKTPDSYANPVFLGQFFASMLSEMHRQGLTIVNQENPSDTNAVAKIEAVATKKPVLPDLAAKAEAAKPRATKKRKVDISLELWSLTMFSQYVGMPEKNIDAVKKQLVRAKLIELDGAYKWHPVSAGSEYVEECFYLDPKTTKWFIRRQGVRQLMYRMNRLNQQGRVPAEYLGDL